MLVSVGLFALLWFQQQQLPQVLQLSRALNGEFWYRISLRDQHVGYLHTLAANEANGNWRYDTHTHVLMQAGEPVNIRKSLVFSGRAPYSLLSAEQETTRGSSAPELVSLVSDAGGMSARNASGEPVGRLPAQFTLTDYLAVEHWLQNGQPRPGNRIRAPTLLFEDLAIGSTAYSLASANEDGYVLVSQGPIGETVTRMNAGLLAQSIDIGGVFQFVLTERNQALAVTSPAFKASYRLPVDQRLRDTASIMRMTLNAVNQADQQLIMSIAAYPQKLSTGDTARATTLHRLPAIKEIAGNITQQHTGADPAGPDLATRILATVQQQLVYQDGAPVASLDEVLKRGYGECTDFADLFGAIAQAAGIPSKTVIGLAYHDTEPYGFAFHAWNEIQVDGQWQVVDPTWNQRFADATHLPLTDHELATLKFYSSRQSARFLVTDMVRRSGHNAT